MQSGRENVRRQFSLAVKTTILASRLYLPRHNSKTRTSCCIAVLTILLITTQRLPAPIVESLEQATPAPESEQPVKSKKKRSKADASESEPGAKSERNSSDVSTPHGPSHFAGTWTGTISQGILGKVATKLVINSSATSVTDKSATYPCRIEGNMLTWHAGWLKEIVWTFTPNKGGQTALATSKSPLGVNGTATFYRQRK
jgi:hypothetical protein